MKEFEDAILDLARQAGAEYPQIQFSSDDKPVIVDMASGRTWKVVLEEF